MEYLKKFEQHSEYEAYISGGGVVLPNVSICVEEGDVHYNPAPPADAIDLGLPSGRLWCNHNVGAATETDYGDHFMWGSTTPDTNNTCDWAHAPFNNGQSDFDETYFNAHKTEWLDGDVLKLEYDAAHVIMGGNWKMPTKADLDELLSGTTNNWVTNYKGSGVNGRLFTSKTNGKTLFFPAAGIRIGSSFDGQGDGGFVWSSLHYTNSPSGARKFLFYSGGCSVQADQRYYGYSVRGVL